MLQYNDEKSFIDNWRTRNRPHTKVQEIILFNSLMKGAASDAFTKQFELLSDMIIDIKTQEKEGRIEHVLRVRRCGVGRTIPDGDDYASYNGEVALAA